MFNPIIFNKSDRRSCSKLSQVNVNQKFFMPRRKRPLAGNNYLYSFTGHKHSGKKKLTSGPGSAWTPHGKGR